MDARDFREMKVDELRDRTNDLWVIYNRLSEDVMSGKEKDHSKLKQARKDIARALTILHEKERAGEEGLPENSK